jgi:hypothetical protein
MNLKIRDRYYIAWLKDRADFLELEATLIEGEVPGAADNGTLRHGQLFVAAALRERAGLYRNEIAGEQEKPLLGSVPATGSFEDMS